MLLLKPLGRPAPPPLGPPTALVLAIVSLQFGQADPTPARASTSPHATIVVIAARFIEVASSRSIIRRGPHRWNSLSIAKINTPVTDTYSQIGNVYRDNRRCPLNRPARDRYVLTRISGSTTTASAR